MYTQDLHHSQTPSSHAYTQSLQRHKHNNDTTLTRCPLRDVEVILQV